MKLIYFTDRDLRKGNAEAVHVLEVVRSLAAQGHEVTLLAPVAVDVPAGVQLSTYGRSPSAQSGIFRWIQQLLIGPVLATRRMRAGNYDGMYVRLTIPLLLSTWLLRWACGDRPLILEVNGILRSELGARRRLMYIPILPFEGVLLRQASAVVAASEQIQRDLVQRHHPLYVVAIPNGVNPNTFHPIARPEARRQLGLTKTGPLIGFVGNFAPWHGLEVLLRALPIVRQKHPVARLIFVGGGPHRDVIDAEVDRLGIRDCVDMVGVVPHELIPIYINSFSCCVSPAIPLGELDPGRNSLKVFEYLACGVPVVISDLPGVAKLIEDRQLGVVVPPGNEHQLADAISAVLLYDKPTLERIRKDARSAVVQEYSWDANVARVIELFEEHLPADTIVRHGEHALETDHTSKRSPS